LFKVSLGLDLLNYGGQMKINESITFEIEIDIWKIEELRRVWDENLWT
jgi:hypothetical protein